MKKMIKQKLFLVLLVLLLPSLLSADSQTIRPDANGHFTQWIPSGCDEDYQCVDEETPDDEDSYVYISIIENESFFCSDIDFTSIDSLKITARSRTTEFMARTNAWAIGYSWTDGEVNYWVIIEDNITLNPEYTTVTSDAVTEYQDENPWTSATVNSSAFGIRLKVSLGAYEMRCTQVYVMVWGTAVEGGKTSALLKMQQRK